VSFELNRKVLLRIVYEEAKEAFVSAGRPDGGWLPGAATPNVGIIEALGD
jgi:hypothetical protein